MPSKRGGRRPAAAQPRRRTTATAAPPAPAAEPSAAAQRSRPAASPSRNRPAPARTATGDDPQWSRWSLAVLLGLTLAVQLVVGAVTHVVSNRQRLLVVDLFFFQAPFVLAAAVLAMPLAKVLTHQPRMLRLLEALSLGAVYALFLLLLTSVVVHPATTATATADQLIDKLTYTDALGIALSDVLALVATVQVYPTLARMLSAPGRRARQRMLEKRAAAGSTRARPAKDDRGRR